MIKVINIYLGAVLLVSLFHAGQSVDLCKYDFCQGIQARDLSGNCQSSFQLCNDNDATTVDDCDGYRCTHVVTDETKPKCFAEDCTPDCDGKECGEDTCGGFCGSCNAGDGCANFVCVSGATDGSCEFPFHLGNGQQAYIVTGDRVSVTSVGDTSSAVHKLTPSCNTLTASPEIIFAFQIPNDVTYGYEFRSSGYDTVLQLMKDVCESNGAADNVIEKHIIGCNDDGTPPGDLGSRISGEIDAGIYYVMVDGYSTDDKGPFELTATFTKDCLPLCDGSFCGSDSCGGFCGSCLSGEECKLGRCFPENCQPACDTRTCGDNGCGGSCGVCDEANGFYCVGEAFGSSDTSSCQAFAQCDNFAPECQNCSGSQICGSDCLCYDSLEDLPDLTVVQEHMLDESFIQDVFFPESSCALVEGCINTAGLRRLLRFTSSVLNQGRVDLSFPEPKDRPDLFQWGFCHNHYHFRSFASYNLYESDGTTVALSGAKYAYCMEDTVRYFDGQNIQCEKAYDCGFQGIQSGWVDSYGYSLDCSWIDITDLTAGSYILEVEANPSRVFAEVSFENNKESIRVTIPNSEGPIDQPLKLETATYKAPITASPKEGKKDKKKEKDTKKDKKGGKKEEKRSY